MDPESITQNVGAPRRPGWVAAALAAGAVLMLLAAVLGWRMLRSKSGSESSRAGTGSAAAGPQAPAEAWQSSVVSHLALETPFPLKTAADMTTNLPEAVKEMIEQTETSEGYDPVRDLRLTVLAVEYRGDVPLSLEGAAREQMSSAAAAVGDLHPAYQVTPTTISGHDARRTEYHHHGGHGDVYLNCLLILRGQQLWQVQASYSSAREAKTADRILSSVTVLPEIGGGARAE